MTGYCENFKIRAIRRAESLLIAYLARFNLSKWDCGPQFVGNFEIKSGCARVKPIPRFLQVS